MSGARCLERTCRMSFNRSASSSKLYCPKHEPARAETVEERFAREAEELDAEDDRTLRGQLLKKQRWAKKRK
jgi:hypothetical protein